MLFTNVGIPGGKEQTSSIRIEGSKIISVGNDSGGNTGDKSDVRINFDGALAFPGLINSHDHLEFNLYPQLADKVYEAGKYEVEFNAANLPSGVYFYNLTTGSNSVMKKMILMK